MTGDVNMNNNRVQNVPIPTGPTQPTTLIFTDLKYIRNDGSSQMTGDLNMKNKK